MTKDHADDELDYPESVEYSDEQNKSNGCAIWFSVLLVISACAVVYVYLKASI